MAQEVKFIRELNFPDSLITSECALTYYPTAPSRMAGVFLTINPRSETPQYFSSVIASDNKGENWQTIKALGSLAADPWIQALPNGNLVVTDISEGRQFHLKSYQLHEQDWHPILQDTYGHDHSTILLDSLENEFYIFSTQKKSHGHRLFVYRRGINKKTGDTTTYEIFNNTNFSIKKPVILKNHIAIPVVLKGSSNNETTTQFGEMSSWLVMYNKKTKELSPPQLITILSGAKHHILVQGSGNSLHYFFTDIAREKLMVTTLGGNEQGWSIPHKLVSNSMLTNLDAAINYQDKIVISYTKEVKTGQYKKMLLGLNKDLSIDFEIQVSPLSIPKAGNSWAGKAWPQGGDYSGMIGHPDGHIYMLWSSAPKGLFKPYFAKISMP